MSAWTPASRLGRVMAMVSLSTYLGDFATRVAIGLLLAHGVAWRSLYWMSGCAIACLLVVVLARQSLLLPSPTCSQFLFVLAQACLRRVGRPKLDVARVQKCTRRPF